MIRLRSLRPLLPLASLTLGLTTTLGLASGLSLSGAAARAVELNEGAANAVNANTGNANTVEPTAPAATAVPAPNTTVPAPNATATLTPVREVVLELKARRISLVENGKVMSSWPVAIGDPSTPTPTGRFTVQNKVLNPQYQSTKSGKVNPTLGANSPLGDRWIGFLQNGLNQYGIHGTPNAWSWTVTSRSAVTNGCVRMLHDHVRKLYELVDVGTPVVVRQ